MEWITRLGLRGWAGLAAAFGWAVLAWVLLHPVGAAWGQEILIVRSLGNALAQVDQSEVEFEVMVSAFSPVLSVKINGEAQKIEPAATVRVRRTLFLKKGANTVVVEAATETEEMEKEFEILFTVEEIARREPEFAEKKAFQLITVIGAEHSSNVFKAPEALSNTTPGTRLFTVFVPRYDFALDDGETLRIQSIISRDKFNKNELKSEEFAFTQLTASWIIETGSNRAWTWGAGYNSLYQGYDSILQGEQNKQEDSFLFGTYRLGSRGHFSLIELGLEVKQLNAFGGISKYGRDEDALVTTLRTALTSELLGMESITRISLAHHEADGRYKDKDVYRLSEKLSNTFESFILGFGFKLRQNEYAEKDPAFNNVRPSETLLTYFTSGTWVLSPSWLIKGEVSAQTHRSTVPSSEYTNEVVNTAIVYIY